MSPLAQYRGRWKVPSSNESETQAPLKPHAPAPPLQTLTFWSES